MSDIFAHNVRVSLMVIGGEFEAALEDLITQLESPPERDGRRLTAWEMTRITAEAMCEGFAGLPPNGFDFATWLWDSAPLHVVSIPHANSIGTAHGYRYGVVHLRKIAAMIAGSYVQQQPQKAQLAVELIDTSLDWVDARSIVSYTLVDHYDAHIENAGDELAAMTGSQRPWRRLIPIGVAAHRLGLRRDDSAAMYHLLQLSFAHADDPHVYQALRYTLRIAGMYGDQHALLDFLATAHRDSEGRIAALLCESLRNPRLPWEGMTRDEMLDLLRGWQSDETNTSATRCIQSAIADLEARAE